jgi:hypothetical protein
MAGRPAHGGGVGSGAQVSLEARVLFSRVEGGPPGRTAVDSAASKTAGARVVGRALRRMGVEGPTLTQDAREASSARGCGPISKRPCAATLEAYRGKARNDLQTVLQPGG